MPIHDHWVDLDKEICCANDCRGSEGECGRINEKSFPPVDRLPLELSIREHVKLIVTIEKEDCDKDGKWGNCSQSYADCKESVQAKEDKRAAEH